jgi:hypothetical protein
MRFKETPKDDIIVGIAILTAVTLKPTDNVPRKSVMAIHHLRESPEGSEGFDFASMARLSGPPS